MLNYFDVITHNTISGTFVARIYNLAFTHNTISGAFVARIYNLAFTHNTISGTFIAPIYNLAFTLMYISLPLPCLALLTTLHCGVAFPSPSLP
jgi:hypothetical protein